MVGVACYELKFHYKLELCETDFLINTLKAQNFDKTQTS